MTHFNTILPSVLSSSNYEARYMFRPSHPLWFEHNICGRVQIMEHTKDNPQ
jgi:hypothetical protein